MRRFWSFPLCAALLVSPANAYAQTVRGTLVEYPGGAPLPSGTIALIDSMGVQVDSARASAQGAFTLRAPAAGVYALHFSHPGYASVPSGWIPLQAGEIVEHRFSVPLISGVALQRMSETIELEQRLQSNLTELCGEPLRPGEAGIVVGVVRRRQSGAALAGAIVRVETGAPTAARFRKATITSANGVYVLCNVPAGTAITRTELAGYRPDEGPIDVRAGEIAWYDVQLRAR